ncbi:MAG: Mur ligase domain-containing protein, partial [Coriobacteriales bacterium]|nr:Mur ligase domain-containing protein [Coriobacteriales bacterium]
MKLTIEHIIQSAQSEMLVPPRDADATLTTLVWDSRLVVEGSLFVAIVGGHVNGNDYIIQALEAGAGAVIASQVPTAAIRDAARQSGAALFLAADNDA